MMATRESEDSCSGASESDARRLDELRNCLAPIVTGAEVARLLSVDNRQRRALEIVKRQAMRLNRLLERFDEDRAVECVKKRAHSRASCNSPGSSKQTGLTGLAGSPKTPSTLSPKSS